MTEAVEWRQADVHNKLELIYGLAWLVVALATIAILPNSDGIGQVMWSVLGLGAVISAMMQLLLSHAQRYNGRIRRWIQFSVAGKQFVSFEDPPLNDWHDDLEERGAFEVSYESK